MNIVRVFKNSQNLWLRISLLLSLGFLALGAILLVLGDQLLEDSRHHVLEQRLVIAQMVANQIDRSLKTIINELELTVHLTDFDPSNPGMDEEAWVMDAIYSDSGLPITQLLLLNVHGQVVLTHPPDPNIVGTDLSGLPQMTETLDRQDIFVSTPWPDPVNENLLTTITIPIYEGERFLGWLRCVADLDESSIKAMLLDAVTQDNTAHAILVDRQGRALISTFDLPFLSPGEHQTFYRRAMSQNEAVIEEVLFELDLPNEPPGHHHIMAFVPLETAPWGVSVGGDVIEETFAAPYRLFLGLAALFVTALVVIWGTTMLSAKRLLEPVQKVNLKFDISRQIANVKDWDELTALIVRIPSIFLPVHATRLLLPDGESEIKMAAEWSSDAKSPPRPNLAQTARICESCALARNVTTLILAPCYQETDAPSTKKVSRYCFPLVHQNSLLGTLHLFLPSDITVSSAQLDILTSVASDMAIALESAQLQRLNLKQSEITQAEQKRIFRALHDTIGQNISFLHLKLDQYSTMNPPLSISEIQQDIERMRDIANQAYKQMRDMLMDLNPETQSDLVPALRSRGNSVAQRAKFNLEFTVEGEPANAPQPIKRQVLYIMNEALNNIEQHAHARNVSVRLRWGNGDLTITITDDGTGFERGKTSPEEHFGLRIMEDRARSINGKLSITSSPEIGSQVKLWIPL